MPVMEGLKMIERRIAVVMRSAVSMMMGKEHGWQSTEVRAVRLGRTISWVMVHIHSDSLNSSVVKWER